MQWDAVPLKEKWFSIADLARRWNVEEQFIENIDTRKLPYFKTRRTRMFHLKEILAYEQKGD